jgi:ATP-dependent Lhr-like helicase
LGLDVGDLDRVIQIDAPGSVASFLQRLGRTGRRVGSRRNMLFIATSGEALLQALAINRLFGEGYVEPVVPPPLPYHLLVQQLFAMIFERGGEVGEADFLSLLRRVPGLAEALDTAWLDIREHLVAGGWLVSTGAKLALGTNAEAKFRGKGLADLCVSFDSPRTFAAMHGTVLVGHVDPLSLAGKRDAALVLALGGRSWRVVSSDWSRARVHVVPSEEKGSSRWLGPERGTSRVLSQKVRDILADATPGEDQWLSGRAKTKLAELQEELEDTLRTTPVEHAAGGYTWWTYGGLAENLLLAGRITAAGGTYGTVTAWSVKFTLSPIALERAGGWRGLATLQPFWEPSNQPKFADLLQRTQIREMTLRRVQAMALIGRRTN